MKKWQMAGLTGCSFTGKHDKCDLPRSERRMYRPLLRLRAVLQKVVRQIPEHAPLAGLPFKRKRACPSTPHLPEAF